MTIDAEDKESQELVYNRNLKWNENKDKKIYDA